MPTLAPEWRIVDFFVEIPQGFQGSLLRALHRSKARALLANVPDTGPLLLLRMRSAVGLMEGGSSVACQRLRNDNAWILALTPGPSEFPAGSLVLSNGGLQIGNDGLQLKQMPPFRPWSWRWKPTCGFGYLTVYVDRTQEQLQQWLRENPHLETAEERKVFVGKGILSFSTRLHRALSRQEAAFDHALLNLLAHGALGELSFDLVDSDYGALCATGHSCAELRDYLDPAFLWNDERYQLTVRLNPDEDPWDTICAAIQQYAGLEHIVPETLPLTPIAQLPRWLTVEVPLRMEPVDLTKPAGWNHRIRLRTSTIYPDGLWDLRNEVRFRSAVQYTSQDLMQGVEQIAGERITLSSGGEPKSMRITGVAAISWQALARLPIALLSESYELHVQTETERVEILATQGLPYREIHTPGMQGPVGWVLRLKPNAPSGHPA